MSLTLTNSNKNKWGGFTLVELLVSISMMAIVTASIFGYSRNSENQNNLNRAQERLMFELKRTEDFAMNNSRNPADPGKWIQWGIQVINENSYQLVSRTCPEDLDNDSNKAACHTGNPIPFESIITLPTSITISSTTPVIYFLAPEPTVYKESVLLGNDIPVTFTLQYNHGQEKQKTITVNAIGQVNSN